MKPRILLLLLSGILSMVALAATPYATFKRIWLEHNVMYKGEKCLKVCGELNVFNATGHTVQIAAYLESPKGKKHLDKNKRYYAADGQVCTWEKWNIHQDNAYWKEIVLYLPNDEIHPLPGSNTYYVFMQVSEKGTVFGRSGYDSFTMTCASAQPSKPQSSTDMEVPCVLCHQSGKCGVCGGLGYTVSRYGYLAGQPVSCNYCLGNGQCKSCHGKGYSIIQNFNGNVYIDGVYAPPAVGGGSSGSGSSGSHGSGNSGTCSRCGGTGVSRTANSGGSMTKWVAYYNSSGTQCPYCGGYSAHYHDRCSSCNIPR